MPSPTGTTLEPVVSSAIASTWSPEMPAAFTAARVASASAAHVVVMRLRGEIRILALAVQRILGDRRRQHAALAVDDRGAHAERAEIDSRHDGHGCRSSEAFVNEPVAASVQRSERHACSSRRHPSSALRLPVIGTGTMLAEEVLVVQLARQRLAPRG